MDHVDRNYKLFHKRIGTEYAISSLSLPNYDEGQENNAHAILLAAHLLFSYQYYLCLSLHVLQWALHLLRH